MTLENGKLPESWLWASFDEVTEPRIDQSGPDERRAEFTYVDISSINNETKQIAEPKVLLESEAPQRARQRLEPGDVLVSMTRPNLNAVAIVPRDMPQAIGSTGFHVLRSQHVAAGWLNYLVQTTSFVDAMSRIVQGVVYPAVRPKDVRAYRIPLAPLPEQHRIVSEIETQFTRLDAAVAALESAQAKLKRYRASVLKAACEGRLVPTEAELALAEGRGFESADVLLERVLGERRAKWEDAEGQRLTTQRRPAGDEKWKGAYKEPFESEFGALPSLPLGWEWTNLDTVTFFIVDYRGKTPPTADSGIPIISAANIKAGRVIMDSPRYVSQETYSSWVTRGLPQPGDLIVTTEAPVGEVALYPSDGTYLLTRRVIACQTIWVESQYLALSLMGQIAREHFKAHNRGTTVPRILKPMLMATPIALPPLSEQQRIVEDTERRYSLVDELGATIEKALGRANRLRQSILKRAFEGKLVPQDPSDEPASLLLERIRAEREQEDANARPKQKRRARSKAK